MCDSLTINPRQFKFEKRKLGLRQRILEIEKPHHNKNVDCCR